LSFAAGKQLFGTLHVADGTLMAAAFRIRGNKFSAAMLTPYATIIKVNRRPKQAPADRAILEKGSSGCVRRLSRDLENAGHSNRLLTAAIHLGFSWTSHRPQQHGDRKHEQEIPRRPDDPPPERPLSD